MGVRTLALVFGDQLDPAARHHLALDPEEDALWMAEGEEEISDPPAHKRRIALFLSAMRHYRDAAREAGFTVHYHELTGDPDDDEGRSFGEVLAATVPEIAPERLVAVEPGDWRVAEALRSAAEELGLPLELRPDPHFLLPLEDFEDWAEGRKRFLLEDFYRMMRKRTGILMESDQEPVGGEWNYDEDNRESFGKDGPDDLPSPPTFEPDEVTREVLELVEARWPSHPGRLEDFAEAVTPEQASEALQAFVRDRLPRFGTYQDALWQGEPFLYHSRLSGSLNLKLLDPRNCLEAAEDALRRDHAPLNAVEGFIRQILGWREYVRGIYWTFMPEYQDRNALECEDLEVPAFFWDGETEMACVADAMATVLDHGYAHHIQRLMVLGLFAQLYGVHPYRFHEWHMALYLDAVDWVSLPNTLGMSQFGDGGLVGTKPYCASGRYISRQGNHCSSCRYRPDRAAGDDACPFTSLYWDFLARHRERLRDNRRMAFQMKNLERKDPAEVTRIRTHARELRERIRQGEAV
ncbi:MAG: cryptochrome/photolyase family protein [Gemmatimonadota bacterium]